MGILDNIKKLYNKADTAVGGVLPGGVSSNKTTPTVSQPTSSMATSAGFGQTTSNNIYNNPTLAKQVSAVSTQPTVSSGPMSSMTQNSNPFNQTPYSVPQASSRSSNTVTQPSTNTFVPTAQTVPVNNNTGGTIQGSSFNTSSNTFNNPTQNRQATSIVQDVRNAADWYFNPQNELNKFLGTNPTIDPITGQQTFNTAPIALPGVGPLGGAVSREASELIAGATAAQAEKLAASQLARQGGQRLITNLETKGAEVLSGQLGKEVAEAAAGNAVKVGAGEVAVNTATAATRLEWLKQFLSANKYALAVAGVAGSWVATGIYSQNELGDTVQSLQMKADEARKAGDLEFAQDLTDRMKELEKLHNILTVLKGPISYHQIIGEKISNAVTSTQEAIDKANENIVNDQLIETKYESGKATPEEISKYIARNPYSPIAAVEKQKEVDALKGEPTPEEVVNTKQTENNILSRMKGMTYQDIVSDPEIVAFAQDQNNLYSSVTKLYNDAVVKIVQDSNPANPFGSAAQAQVSTPNTAYEAQTYEAPSSLNFGLLKTSGGYQTVKKDSPEAQSGTFVTDTNEISQYYFGINYSKLTAQQKQLVDMMK